MSTVYSKKVHQTWSSLVEAFESEIAVLVDAPIEEIFNIHEKTAQAVSLYREERFTIVEGGGGRYGEIVFEEIDPEDAQAEKKIASQRSLDMF